eukprot:5266701-Karenia_brevis.AAC.1
MPRAKKDDESCQGRRTGVSFEQESWAVIRMRWTAWYESLMSDQTCRPTAEQFTVIRQMHLRTKYEFFVENNLQ